MRMNKKFVYQVGNNKKFDFKYVVFLPEKWCHAKLQTSNMFFNPEMWK